MENIFEPILDDNEKVVKVFKPNKFMMYFKDMFATVASFLGMYLFVLIGLILSTLEEPEAYPPLWKTILISLAIFVGLVGVILLLEWLFLHLYYKNVYYGYTNKRIVIRKGIFGVDYKALDIKMIGASDVNVSLLDKIMKRNTGTIRYGSMASPINGTTPVGNFVIANIEDPYNVYKEIKSYISHSVDDTTAETKKAPAKKPAAKKPTSEKTTTKKPTTKKPSAKKAVKKD